MKIHFHSMIPNRADILIGEDELKRFGHYGVSVKTPLLEKLISESEMLKEEVKLIIFQVSNQSTKDWGKFALHEIKHAKRQAKKEMRGKKHGR